MNREQFLAALRESLAGMPQEDIDRSVDFYREMIEDSMEDGVPEAEAVSAIGSVQEIAAQIRPESLPKPVQMKLKKKRRFKAWEIVLLVLGSPLWVPLLFAAFMLLFSALLLILMLYVFIWCTLIVFYAADLTIAAGALAGLLGTAVYLSSGNAAGAVFSVGTGLFCAGTSVLVFYGCNWLSMAVIRLGEHTFHSIKSCFNKKEAMQ